jgi:hypothetical protein
VPLVLHMHLEPGRGGLEQRHIAFTLLMPGQQFDRFIRQHPKDRADRGGDAAVVQRSADHHLQVDRPQPADISSAAVLTRDPKRKARDGFFGSSVYSPGAISTAP